MTNCVCAHSSVIMCLFPSWLRNLGNKHQNNPFVSAEIVRHSSASIILYLSHGRTDNQTKEQGESNTIPFTHTHTHLSSVCPSVCLFVVHRVCDVAPPLLEELILYLKQVNTSMTGCVPWNGFLSLTYIFKVVKPRIGKKHCLSLILLFHAPSATRTILTRFFYIWDKQ